MTTTPETVFPELAYCRIRGGISATDTDIPIYPGDASNLLPAWTSGQVFYLTITDAENHIEVVKVTDIKLKYLTVERGQDSTVARLWYDGAMMNPRLNTALLDACIQQGAERQVAFNPNGVLTPSYRGEKVFQTGQKIWWKNISGTDWQLIAGELATLYDIAFVSSNEEIYASESSYHDIVHVAGNVYAVVFFITYGRILTVEIIPETGVVTVLNVERFSTSLYSPTSCRIIKLGSSNYYVVSYFLSTGGSNITISEITDLGAFTNARKTILEWSASDYQTNLLDISDISTHDYAFIVAGDGRLLTYWFDGTNIQSSGSLDLNGNYCSIIKIDGTVYAAINPTDQKLYTIDLSDETDPQVISSISIDATMSNSNATILRGPWRMGGYDIVILYDIAGTGMAAKIFVSNSGTSFGTVYTTELHTDTDYKTVYGDIEAQLMTDDTLVLVLWKNRPTSDTSLIFGLLKVNETSITIADEEEPQINCGITHVDSRVGLVPIGSDNFATVYRIAGDKTYISTVLAAEV